MDIYGIGYMGFESPNGPEMLDYCPEVFGFGVNENREGGVYFKTDDRSFRLAIHPGEVTRVAYIGWECRDRFAFEAGVEQLRSAGIAVQVGDAELEAKRGVHGVAQFLDPAGWPHELFYAQGVDPGRFLPGRGHAGFLTERHGFGHTVLVAPNLDEIENFTRNIMGFSWFGHGLIKNMLTFWRAKHSVLSHNLGYGINPAHQFGDTASSLPHIGIYVAELDDVGIAYDMVQERGMPIVMTLGRHAQDPVVSFYSVTPAGFTIEYIWITPECEMPPESFHEVRAERLSVWGHKMLQPPPGMGGPSAADKVAEPAPASAS
jgi:2,3-dihydroxybiphenyl 1,2-dioxygenase